MWPDVPARPYLCRNAALLGVSYDMKTTIRASLYIRRNTMLFLLCDTLGWALLTQYEDRGIGRCSSFLTMTPVSESSAPPQPTVGRYHMQSQTTETANGSEPLKFALRIATRQPQTTPTSPGRRGIHYV